MAFENSKDYHFVHFDEGEITDYHEPKLIKEEIEEGRRIFKEEYDQLVLKKAYFLGCNVEVYKSNFNDRRSNFLSQYPDALEKDFLMEELGIVTTKLSGPYYYADSETLKNLKFSLDRTVEFIIEKLQKLGHQVNIDPSENPDKITLSIFKDDNIQFQTNSTIESDMSPTELIELIKALIESKKVKGKQKDIIDKFSLFFNTPINNPDKLIQDIKKRNNGSETLLLDKLKDAVIQFFQRENRR